MPRGLVIAAMGCLVVAGCASGPGALAEPCQLATPIEPLPIEPELARAFAEALARKTQPGQPPALAAGRKPGGASPFVQGMVSNLLNPKVAVFYLSLFPQFTVAPLPPLAQHALMAGIFLLIALAWYVLLLSALKKVTGVLARPRTSRIVVGSSGAVLVGVGGTILTQTLASA